VSQFVPFTYGQVPVESTATLIVKPGQNSEITLVNFGTNDVYFGDASVTASSGQLLAGTKGTSLKITTTGAVYGITASSQNTVGFFATAAG
jgi:hypothetical protein